MPLVTPNAGELELLDKMIKDALTADENYILKLYSNNYTPDQSSVTGSFTESSFSNYAAKTLTRSGWNVATTVSNKGTAVYGSTQSWTCGASSGTVYGYYITGATSGTTLWCEQFSSARALTNGDVLNLTPQISLNSEN